MFRASLCSSSGEQDRVLLHMVFCTGCAGCGCVGDLVQLGWSGVRVAGFNLQYGHHSNPAVPNLQHTTNRECSDRCGNSTA